MTQPARSVLLVAGRLGVHDEGWSVRPFLDRLARRGLAVQVLCVEAAGEAAADPRVVACPALGRRWRLPLTVRGLRPGGRVERPDLLHVLQSRVGDLGLALAERWGVPYVQTVDEFLPEGGRLRVSRRWCRRLVSPSRGLAAELADRLAVPGRLIAVAHPGIEVHEPGPAAGRREAREVAVIGTAGPLVAASGFVTFLNAARRVIEAGVDAEFVIAGQGADEVNLRRRADRLRIADRVTFAGVPVVGLRFWDVPDVYCQPSLVPSVGRTLATALAFGVPSVASDVEGLRALVEHGRNGLRVAPGDSGALAAGVLGLLGDRARARELGRRGRALIARDFQPEAEAAALAEVYDEALAPAGPSPRSSPATVAHGWQTADG